MQAVTISIRAERRESDGCNPHRCPPIGDRKWGLVLYCSHTGRNPPRPGSRVDAVSAAVTTAVADWPAVHEALVADRASAAGDMAAANGDTIANITITDAISTTQITGIEA